MILHADSLVLLPTLPEESVDGVVTDPPYAVGITRRWDATKLPARQIWSECLRLLRPGRHILAFGASRTYHRLAADIEAAGFVVQTVLAWCYPPGTAKSVGVARAVDEANGVERRILGYRRGRSFFDRNAPRVVQTVKSSAPVSALAKAYEGCGTGLAPAHEPIVWATKPLSTGKLPTLPRQPLTLFYRKPGRAERAGNDHPTVKPVALMRDLVTRVTVPGEVVLDPFGGSGTTGVAALLERREFILIEQNVEFVRLICRRIRATDAAVREDKSERP